MMRTDHGESMEDQVDQEADYEGVVARARQALDAMPDLPASRWVAIRNGIDEGIDRSRAVGTGWAWIAVAVAVAATLVLAQRPVSAPPLSLEHLVTAPVAPKRIEAQPVRPAQPAIASGAVLVAGSASETYEVFGRHRLTLEPGARMEVVAWSQRDLAVRLTAGRVTADIAKAFPGERIQIETTGSIVRVVGTQFSVSYEASGATVVAVTEGVVEVSGKGQAEAPPVRVTAGQTHRVPLVAVAPATAKKRPARGPKTLRKRPQAPAVRDVKPRDGFRVIEIDVPPQQAPNAR